jgi:hypothetical protein
MRNLALFLIGAMNVLAAIPYIIDVLKGKSKPNIASWATWSLLNAIIAVSALAAGDAVNTVVLGFSYFIGSSSVLLLAIFKGTRKYTAFDAVCQSTAVLSLVLWRLTNDPNAALYLVILVDIFAFLPTFRHAWYFPQEETWVTYAISGLTALALTAMATTHSFASLAVTLESGVVCLSLTGLILIRASELRRGLPD